MSDEKTAGGPAESGAEEKAPEAQAERPGEAKAAEPRDWSEQLKKLALAAVGAVNLTPDDVKTFTKKLVEKGELAKKDGEKFLKDFADRVQHTVKRGDRAGAQKAEEPAPAAAGAAPEAGAADKAAADKAAQPAGYEKLAEKINASIERMLHGMNIATRKDLEDLTKQLDELDAKVAQLVEVAQAAAARGARKSAGAPQGAGAGA